MRTRIIFIVLTLCLSGFLIFNTAIPDDPSPVKQDEGNFPLAGRPDIEPVKNHNAKHKPRETRMQATGEHSPEQVPVVPSTTQIRDVYTSDQVHRGPDPFQDIMVVGESFREHDTGPADPLAQTIEKTFDVDMNHERDTFRERMRTQTNPELIKSMEDLGMKDNLIQNFMDLRRRARQNAMKTQSETSETIQWVQHSTMPVYGFFIPDYDYKNDITKIPAEVE